MSSRWHLHLLLVWSNGSSCGGSALLSSALLDGHPGRDAILQPESTVTSGAVGNNRSFSPLIIFGFHLGIHGENPKLCFWQIKNERSCIYKETVVIGTTLLLVHTHTHLPRGSLCSYQFIPSNAWDPEEDKRNHAPAQSQAPGWELDFSIGGWFKVHQWPDQDHLDKKVNSEET